MRNSDANIVKAAVQKTDELDRQVEAVTEQILLLNLPNPGNLRSHKKKDVRMRLKCLQALLVQKERNQNSAGDWREKVRRLEMDVEIKENKCAQLEKRLKEMDRQKYLAELKAKEADSEVRAVQQSYSSAWKGQVGSQSSVH